MPLNSNESEKTTEEVDFAVRADIEGNMAKIKNHISDNLNDHLLISNIMNAIHMYPGKNREFPSFGYAEKLLNLGSSFRTKEETETLLEELENDMRNHYGREIELIPHYNETEDMLTIEIDIGEIPGKIVVTVNNKHGLSKPIETKYI